ncbi:MAG: LysM peptidoglycan-binding domain-containing protein [Clostridiaceae bacterium]
MSTKKLTIISSLIAFLLVASGLAYYITYSNVKKNIAASATNTTDSSQVVKEAEEQTVNTLNTEDEKSATNADTTTQSAANIAKENVNFKYIEYTVKSGDTLFSIARNNAPNLRITDVINNIVERNSLKSKDSIIIGQKISIPQSIDSSKTN